MALYGPNPDYDESTQTVQEWVHAELKSDLYDAYGHEIWRLMWGGCTTEDCYGQDPDCGLRVSPDARTYD